jgi:hypothetical protein
MSGAPEARTTDPGSLVLATRFPRWMETLV